MSAISDTSDNPERLDPMDDVARSIAEAPLPTRRTLHARASVPYQVMRFVAFNIRMLRMVRKAHH
jgi:hypothetical protein